MNGAGDAVDNPAVSKNVSVKFAWIQLGGLRVGKDESAFDTFVGYAGAVIQDTIVPYGDFDTNVVQYYFDAGSGFSAVVSLEEGEGSVGTIDSYVPHVVGGVKYKQDWGAITGVVAYDSN
ncbi:porin, partial [Mesorhizobium sp. M2E.F.Ca.ET.209.01.1.1]|uniref:porin n=1 Tax=Mesorhizobium sp. M2E.F.Ca.ET.209.01.1.1 TaxID=2500526 RepID=UPI001FEEB777